MTDDNKLTREQFRLLTVVYKLAKGKTDLPVHEDDIAAELERSGVLDMTDKEFDQWHKKVVENIKHSQN